MEQTAPARNAAAVVQQRNVVPVVDVTLADAVVKGKTADVVTASVAALPNAECLNFKSVRI